jgi:hypothetical protein
MKSSFKTALIAAVVSAVVAAGAAVATTQTFLLGSTNRVNAASSVTNLQSNGTTVNPVDAALLTLDNESTTPNSTPLSLFAAPNHPPLKVNRSVKVANLNADRLDGIDSAEFARGGPPAWTLVSGTTPAATAAPGKFICYFYDIKNCWGNYAVDRGGNWTRVAYTKDAFGFVHLKGLIDCEAQYPGARVWWKIRVVRIRCSSFPPGTALRTTASFHPARMTGRAQVQLASM